MHKATGQPLDVDRVVAKPDIPIYIVYGTQHGLQAAVAPNAKGGASFALVWTFAAGDIILRPTMLGMRRH